MIIFIITNIINVNTLSRGG